MTFFRVFWTIFLLSLEYFYRVLNYFQRTCFVNDDPVLFSSYQSIEAVHLHRNSQTAPSLMTSRRHSNLQAPSTWKSFFFTVKRVEIQKRQLRTFTKTDWMLLPVFKFPKSRRRCKKIVRGRKITIHCSLEVFSTFFGRFPLGISHKKDGNGFSSISIFFSDIFPVRGTCRREMRLRLKAKPIFGEMGNCNCNFSRAYASVSEWERGNDT